MPQWRMRVEAARTMLRLVRVRSQNLPTNHQARPKQMPDLKVISMDDDELELENTIRQLIERKDAAVEGSAEYRMVIRQLKGLRNSRELAGPIMEEYDYWGGD